MHHLSLLVRTRLVNLAPKLTLSLAVLLLSACSPSSNDTADQASNTTQTTAAQTGVYSVGSRTLFINDFDRPYDSVAGVNVGVRSMITEIWYPVSQATIRNTRPKLRRANYGDYVFGNLDIHRKMMTQTTFWHLTKDTTVEGVSQEAIDNAIDELFGRKRGSYLNAPLDKSGGKFPVIVMTHGDAGSRYNMETVCEYLASRGYVVIAPEHTGNSPFSMTSKDQFIDTKLAAIKPLLNADGTYGSPEKFGQTYTPLVRDRNDPMAMVNLDNALLQRVNDLRATLAKLDELNQGGEFANRLQLDNIGLIGRSFGGTTTIAALNLEPRFSAGVAVVPLLTPDFRSNFPAQYLKESESVILPKSGPTALSTLSKPTMLLSGAEDALIIGVGVGLAQASGTELPTVDNPLPALRHAYQESDQPVVWGLLNDSNHSSFGVSGGYWWPELKPHTQARFFDKDQSFDLISPSRAHTIQKSKVLQFFDTMIRKDQNAKTKLLENEYQRDGLLYEHRNF